MMKKLVATLGLLATVAYAQDSDAGCAVTVLFTNGGDGAVTVLEVETRVSLATWVTILSSDFNVPANGTATRAIELKTGCAPPHDFRVKFKRGNNTYYATKGPVATLVDRKIGITLP